MATDLERLVVSLSADIKAYERALAKAQGVTTSALRKIETDSARSMGRFEKTMGRAGSALSGFGKGLALGAVASLGALVAASVSSAAAIGDLADKIGITTDKLQELQYGAVQANIDFSELEKGLLKFSKSLGEAQNGSGDLFKILQANGFSQAQIKALDYGRALDVVADLIKNTKNQQDGLLVSTAGFGKGAADVFLEFLRDGRTGLEGFSASAKKAGDVIDGELIRAAQVLDDAWATVMNSMTKRTSSFVLTTIKEFQAISGLLDAVTSRMKKFGTEPIRGGGPFNPALLGFGPPGNSPSELSGFPRARTTPGNSPSELSGFPNTKGPVTKLPPSPDDISRLKEYAREKEKQRETIEKVIKALELEGINLGKSNVQQEIASALARADVSAKSEQGKKIIALVEANEMHRAAIEATEYAAQQATERQEQFAESLTQLGEAGLSAFDQWAAGGEKLTDVIADLTTSLLKAAVQASLFGSGPLAGLFGTGASGGVFGAFNQPKLYAGGGQISSGSIGIAGEAGPELIQGPANVIPINKIRGGGTNVQIIDQRTNAPQVEKQQGADGSLRFFIRDAVLETLGSGKANKVMREQFGATPKVARR